MNQNREDNSLPEEQETKHEPGSEPSLESFSVSELEASSLRDEVAKCREYKEKYLRLLAETENVRKRMQKEKQESIDYAQRELILEFLHPIDHMENALKFTTQGSDEVKNWALGFQMILNQFKSILSSEGVEAFDSLGVHFDPHLHEAIDVIHTDQHAPGTIVEETLKGYTFKGKPLRPARVTVAKQPAAEAESPLAADE